MDFAIQLFNPSDRGYTVTGNPPAPAGIAPDVFDAGTGACNYPHPLNPAACAPPFSVAPGSVTSENDFFLIPGFGYNWMLDDRSTAGISVYGNGGMDTEFKDGSSVGAYPSTPTMPMTDLTGAFGAGPVGISLAQLFLNLSYAYKIEDDQAVGASLILAYQRFNSFGLEYFGAYSNDPSSLAGNIHSYSTGLGFKLGYQGEVGDGLSVGISYQSKVSMSEFDEYKGLFAEQGDFDVPSTYTLGLAYDLGDADKVLLDVQRINYTDVAAVSNPIGNLTNGTCNDALNSTIAAGGTPTPASGIGCLGGASGAGFGWVDITVIKLGYEMEIDDTVFRFGYSKTEQPIPESETLFNILAPAVNEQHVTFGMTMPVGKDQEFNLAVMIAPNTTVKGANPFDGGATQIEIEMMQKDIQVGWAWKY